MAEENTATEEKKDDAPATEAPKEDAPATAEEKIEPAAAGAEKTEDAPVEVPKKFKSLVEEIEKMSVLDLSELVGILEDKFGVSAAAPAMMMAGPATAGDAGGAAEEKSEFSVELTEIGGNKIGVIKAVKAATGLGLADAKGLVDGAPAMLKEGVKKEEAEAMKASIEEAGGKVTLK